MKLAEAFALDLGDFLAEVAEAAAESRVVGAEG